MRKHFATGALAAAVALSGCGCQTWSRWRNPDPFGEKAPQRYSAELTKDQLIEHLNQNILAVGEVPAWRCDRVKVQMTGIPASLPATLAVRAPHSLRMRVANPLTGGDALDLGSNDQYFWMWMKDGSPSPPVMTVRHDEVDLLAQSSVMPIPVHPHWLMEVLGVVPLEAAEYSLVKPTGNQPYVDLVAERTAPDGERVQRIIRVNPRHGIIVEHRLQKLNGDLLGKASLSRHFQDPQSGAVMPRLIAIDAPIEGRSMSMTMTFDAPEVNPPSLVSDDHLWLIPEIPGSPRVDLADLLRHQGRLPPRTVQEPNIRKSGFSRTEAPAEAAPETGPVSLKLEEGAEPEAANPFARRNAAPVEQPEAYPFGGGSEPLDSISRRPRE